MKQLQRATRETVPYSYRKPQRRLYAQERVIPPPYRRKERGAFATVLMIVGPMLLVGLGGIMFWLGWMTW